MKLDSDRYSMWPVSGSEGVVAGEGKTMLQMITRIIKWVSIPVLLIGSIFSPYAASYELLVDCVICLGAIVFLQRAIRSKEYLWAAGLIAIAVVFSPFLLVI